MSARAEINQLKNRLEAAFDRGRSVPPETELGADIARHLCILVCGYLERSLVSLLTNHARENTESGRLMKRLVHHLRRWQNPKKGRIVELISTFDEEWGNQAATFIVDERAAAIGSLVNLRNRIAHGDWTDVGYIRVREYFGEVQRVVVFLTDLIDPQS